MADHPTGSTTPSPTVSPSPTLSTTPSPSDHGLADWEIVLITISPFAVVLAFILIWVCIAIIKKTSNNDEEEDPELSQPLTSQAAQNIQEQQPPQPGGADQDDDADQNEDPEKDENLEHGGDGEHDAGGQDTAPGQDDKENTAARLPTDSGESQQSSNAEEDVQQEGGRAEVAVRDDPLGVCPPRSTATASLQHRSEGSTDLADDSKKTAEPVVSTVSPISSGPSSSTDVDSAYASSQPNIQAEDTTGACESKDSLRKSSTIDDVMSEGQAAK